MRQQIFLSVIAAVAGLFVLTACASSPSTPTPHGHPDTTDHGHAADAGHTQPDEHMADGAGHMHAVAPPEYADLTNPLADDDKVVAAGQELYAANCALCHGPQGQGDGPGATGLTPAPANLANQAMMSGLSDGYLFWRITEGGAIAPFNSTMPSWKEALAAEERWQLVSYIRTLSNSKEK
jgi:mono/diheme cytochrome c family protein